MADVSVPQIITYSIKSKGASVYFPNGIGTYLPLYTGLQTVIATVRGGTGSIHLSTESGYKTRFHSVDMENGKPVTLSNVARPEGENRYLSFYSNDDGADFGIMIVKY